MFFKKNKFGIVCLVTLMLSVTLTALTQTDPDPNSPSPVLISIDGVPQVLAFKPDRLQRSSLQKLEPQVQFKYDTKITLMIGGITSSAEEEGPGAFRVYAQDEKGKNYRFPVLDISPSGKEGIYAMTIRLADEIKYWPAPTDLKDLVIAVSWRGMISNYLMLGSGTSGQEIIKYMGLKPSPLSSFAKKGFTAKGEPETADAPDKNYVGYKYAGDRRRFMEQAGFGTTPVLDERIRRIGIRTWLAEQFEAPYPTPGNEYPDLVLKSQANPEDVTTGCGMYDSSTLEYRNCKRVYYSMYPVQNWFFKEALYGDAQLRHRVAWALAQMWVISGVDTQQASWMIAYHKILSNNAFGNYRDLMKEMTLNPGMGNYLDMMRSTKNNPNENYPREILQLFTIGLFELDQNGTLKLDGQGNPIPTYDQNTINNFTKVFTGWRDCRTLSVACPNTAPGVPNYKDPMEFIPNNHDLTAKTLFNYPGAPNPTIPACSGCNSAAIATYAATSLDQTLDNIFYHPNVGPFVSKTLIQHLVTSDPTPAYVGRVAAVFNNNGQGVRGDMKAVIRAILLDPEARGDKKTDPNYGKLREPVQLLTNLFRQVGVKGAGGVGLSDGVVNGQTSNMAQNTFNSPTVFNFYPPDNVIPGTALLGPEFALMTTGTSIARANFANTMVFNQIGVSETAPQGTSLDLTELQSLAAADTTSNRLVDTLNTRLMHGTMSAQMKSSILTAVNSITATNTLQRAKQALYLVATSSQFQVQR